MSLSDCSQLYVVMWLTGCPRIGCGSPPWPWKGLSVRRWMNPWKMKEYFYGSRFVCQSICEPSCFMTNSSFNNYNVMSQNRWTNALDTWYKSIDFHNRDTQYVWKSSVWLRITAVNLLVTVWPEDLTGELSGVYPVLAQWLLGMSLAPTVTVKKW